MFVAPLKSADEVARSVASILRPPRRIRPTEAAAGHLRNDKDVFDPDAAPYLIEPLDRLDDRLYQGIVFAGPARCGKTFGLVLGAVYYIVTVAPADALLIYMSQDTARDFSRMDLDRAIKHTPELAALLSPRARDDNTYDKFFRHGIALKIGWPAATQLRGKTVRYVGLMDVDGAANSANVDGRGSMWGQAFKRIETFMSRGKCLAESSPGFAFDKPDWVPSTPHEAPPALGILSLYNTGTRARYYWRCLHCGEHFQAAPGLDPFIVPEVEEVIEAVQEHDLMMLAESWAKVACPHCGGLHQPHDKRQLNAIRNEAGRALGATWVHEGQQLVDCRLEGEPRRTNIASYWLGGVSASYQPWVSLIFGYLSAVATYVRTGDESDLRRSWFEDLAHPYLPMALRRKRKTDQISSRKETWERGTVPEGVRFLVGVVDVQAHAFVVQMHGFGIGLESWLVDRFKITASKRPEGERHAALDPASYIEDWELIVEEVLQRRYRLLDDERVMVPAIVGCDSGGKEGVTAHSYDFYRSLRTRRLHQRFRLLKGDGTPNAPRTKTTYPDSTGRKDRHAGSRGDVPVLRINVNVVKDGVWGDLTRAVPGPGYVHVSDFVDDAYFDEIQAEERTAKGWVMKPGFDHNEGFDLHTYARALCIELGAEKINWDKPPSWADVPDRNPYVLTPDEPPPARPAARVVTTSPATARQNPFARRDGRGFRRR